MFLNELYREGLWNSFIIAVWTTLGALCLALPLAVCYVRFAFPGRALLNSLVLMPLILPPFVGAIGIKTMLGQAGALNSLLINLGLMDALHPTDWLGQHRMLGIILMEVLHLYPIIYLNAAAALSNLDPALEEAAANMGCNAWSRFWRITLPLIMPGVFAGGTIVFVWSFTEMGVPLLFDYDRVTAVQIFRSINDLSGNPFPYAPEPRLGLYHLLCRCHFLGRAATSWCGATLSFQRLVRHRHPPLLDAATLPRCPGA